MATTASPSTQSSDLPWIVRSLSHAPHYVLAEIISRFFCVFLMLWLDRFRVDFRSDCEL